MFRPEIFFSSLHLTLHLTLHPFILTISQNELKHLSAKFQGYILIFQEVMAILKLIFQDISIYFTILKQL